MNEIGNPVSLIERASSELETGNFKSAVQILEEGIQQYGEFPLVFFLLTKAYLNIGEFEKAEKTLSTGLEKFPFNKGLQSLKEEFEKAILTKQSQQSTLVMYGTNEELRNDVYFPFSPCLKRLVLERIAQYRRID